MFIFFVDATSNSNQHEHMLISVMLQVVLWEPLLIQNSIERGKQILRQALWMKRMPKSLQILQYLECSCLNIRVAQILPQLTCARYSSQSEFGEAVGNIRLIVCLGPILILFFWPKHICL